MKVKKGLIVALVLIVVFGGFTVFNVIKFKQKKMVREEVVTIIPVEVTKSKFMTLKWTLEEVGNVKPVLEVDVYPKVSGEIIRKLPVEKGDYVKKGKLLAALEDNTIKAQVEEAEALLESAKMQKDLLEKDCARYKRLYKERALAKQRLDHIKTEYKTAKENVKRLKASLEQLKILYRNHRIYAPISGYISARYIDEGAMSSTKQPIVRISCEKEEKIVTTVTEKDFPHIKKGMKVEIAVDAFPNKIFRGMISIINPTIDPVTRTGEIEIHIPNKELVLRSGMFAHIKIDMEWKRVLAIPRDALCKIPGTGGYFVYVVQPTAPGTTAPTHHRAVLKNIKVGMMEENYAEVIEGLKENELVVIKGQSRLKGGAMVKITNWNNERGTIKNPSSTATKFGG
jgi:HlyD family secretion protein